MIAKSYILAYIGFQYARNRNDSVRIGVSASYQYDERELRVAVENSANIRRSSHDRCFLFQVEDARNILEI